MGVTPNRGYPYPDPSSPMRITEDLQALAEAYDADLKSVQDTVQQRVMFRATASARQAYGAGATATVSYDVLEENNGGALAAGSTSMPRDTFIPNIHGMWMFTATVSYPQWLNIGWVSLELYSTFLVASAKATEMPNNADGNRTISVTGMQEMTGTGTGNSIRAILTTNVAGTRSVFPLFSRSLTGFLVARI